MVEPIERVVFVLPRLSGGGAERVVRAVADHLARRDDVAVELISLLDPAATSHRTAAGVVVRGLGYRRVRRALLPLIRELRARPPRAVMSTLRHVSVGLGLVAPLLPPRTARVVRVANTYSSEIESVDGGSAWAKRALIRLSHRGVSRFVCVSAGVRDDLVREFGVPPERCAVIPNPVDVDDLQQQSRLPPPPLRGKTASSSVRFLSVGRLEVQKDHDTLLRAFALVRQELDAALLVVGDGSRRDALEHLADELGVRDHVGFLGHLDNPYPAFALSDVLVLSSRFEGLPNVLLEALALGLPCVSTDCPHGPADILVDPEFGKLVPVGDPARMSAAMVEVAARPFGAPSGPAYVRRRHDPSAVSGAYLDALLARPSSSHG